MAIKYPAIVFYDVSDHQLDLFHPMKMGIGNIKAFISGTRLVDFLLNDR